MMATNNARFHRPTKTNKKLWFCGFSRDILRGVLPGARFSTSKRRRFDATFDATGGFTGDMFCEPPFDLQLSQKVVVDDQNTDGFKFYTAFFCS